MIRPSVGRIVWYRPSEHDGFPQGADKQPLAAIVTYVHNDRLVNLTVFDAIGGTHRKTSVTLLQDEEGQSAPYAEWMPYQKSVAKGEIAPNIHAAKVQMPNLVPADIGWAVKQMHNGTRVCRAGWNGTGMWIALQMPGEHSKMGLPYVYMSTVDGKLVPWLASQTDLLAIDWEAY